MSNISKKNNKEPNVFNDYLLDFQTPMSPQSEMMLSPFTMY